MENPLEILQKSSPFTEEVEKELSQLSGVQRIMNDQHLPVSYDLQAIESDAEIVGFEKADMTLLQSCILNGEISDYEQMDIVHLKQGGYGLREIARTQKVPMRRIKELLAEVHDVLLDICYG